MSDDVCALCGLALAESAVSGDGGEAFCCPGCANVAETLEELPETVEREDVLDGDGADEGTLPDAPEAGCERSFFRVDGMHCSTCERFIETLAASEEGVAGIDASYVTETVRVDHDPETTDEESLLERLSGLGYAAYRRADTVAKRQHENRTEIRLIVGVLFGMAVMLQYLIYIYPLHTSLFYPEMARDGIVEIIQSPNATPFFVILFAMTSVVLFVTGSPMLKGAYVSLKTRHPSMDLLVSLAAVSAYVYSTLAVAVGRVDVYYDVTVAIVLVVTVGGYYESMMKRRATDLLSELTEARVDEATRYGEDGATETVSLDELRPGDDVLVRGGERVPVDGTVLEGEATVDEAVITGESLPVAKREAERVIGGSVVADGALIVRVDEDGTRGLDRITDLVWNLQSSSRGIQRLADKLATIFVPLVSVLAVVVATGYLLSGSGLTAAALVGLTVLIVSCPCALGLATPLAVATSVREGMERGVVVFDETVFERLRGVETLVFDKTGTLTTGEMEVLASDGPETALELAAALETRSAHPVARAIAEAFGSADKAGDGRSDTPGGSHSVAPDGGRTVPDAGGENGGEGIDERSNNGERTDDREPSGDDRVTDFRSYATGVGGTVEGRDVLVGHPELFGERGWEVPEDLRRTISDEREFGRLPVLVGRDGRAEGWVVVGDEPRDGWDGAIERLDERGVSVVVLTGDDEAAADFFRHHAGVDRVFAGVPPEGKAETVRRLRGEGATAMVGDGTNDAPALAGADLGIAMGSGAALAADAADVAIVDDDLGAIETVFELSEAAGRRVKQNVGWAFCYNAIAIPIAVLGLLNPLFAAVAMAISSSLVVTNSSRSLLPDDEDR